VKTFVEMTWNDPCPGDQVTFTCQVFGSFSLEWRSPLITRTASFFASNSIPRSFDRGPFTASLINVSTNGTFTNANITSTLQVTASRTIMRDETTVMCLSTAANETDNFTVAGNFCCNLFKYARESVHNCVYGILHGSVSVYPKLLIVSLRLNKVEQMQFIILVFSLYQLHPLIAPSNQAVGIRMLTKKGNEATGMVT